VNVAGRDVAYLTLEFAFAHVPPAVRDLQAEGATSDRVALAWMPPSNDRAAPVLGYRVEACELYRASRPQLALADHHQGGGGQSSPRQLALVAYNGDAGRGSVNNRALAWKPMGEYEPMPEPKVVVRNLRSDTRYRFRVRGFSEAGAGEPAEVEVDTLPCAPGVCGQPRLAGCSGPVLAVEWDPPLDDGGMDIVAYRIWVRPYSATRAEGSEWLETGACEAQPGQGATC